MWSGVAFMVEQCTCCWWLLLKKNMFSDIKCSKLWAHLGPEQNRKQQHLHQQGRRGWANLPLGPAPGTAPVHLLHLSRCPHAGVRPWSHILANVAWEAPGFVTHSFRSDPWSLWFHGDQDPSVMGEARWMGCLLANVKPEKPQMAPRTEMPRLAWDGCVTHPWALGEGRQTKAAASSHTRLGWTRRAFPWQSS